MGYVLDRYDRLGEWQELSCRVLPPHLADDTHSVLWSVDQSDRKAAKLSDLDDRLHQDIEQLIPFGGLYEGAPDILDRTDQR